MLFARMLGNWQTSVGGLAVILVTLAHWLSAGDVPITSQDIVQLLMGAGLMASKDAVTGSKPNDGR